MNRLLIAVPCPAVLTFCDTAPAESPAETEAAAVAAAEVVKPYPLKTCLVTDEPLGS